MLSIKFCNTTVGQRGKPQASYTSQHHDNGHHNNIIDIHQYNNIGGGGEVGAETEYLDCTVCIIINNGLMITDKPKGLFKITRVGNFSFTINRGKL